MEHQDKQYQDSQLAHKNQIVSDASSKINEEDNIYYTKNKKVIFWLYLLLTTAFIAVQVYLVSVNWEQMETFSKSDNFYYANQVTYEWQQGNNKINIVGYIEDIKILSDTNCPDGYQSAFNYYWPGTGYGCYCKADANNTFVLQGYCSTKLIQSQCMNLQNEEQRYANFWKNSSLICVKRSKVSFANEQKYNGDTNKLCGNSQTLVVVPENQTCPLVNITFQIPKLQLNYRLIEDNEQKMSPIYGSFNATSPYSFYSYPISKFTVSEYEFCLITQDSGLTPTHQEFILLNYQKGCVNTSKYQIMDSIKQIQFFANNPTLTEISDKVGFPKAGNWIYNFGFSSLPSWNYYCRHNYDQKFAMPTTIPIFNFKFFTSYYYVSLAQIIFFVIVGFQVFILGLRRLMKKQIYPVGYRKQYLPKDFCLSLFRYIIQFVCKFCLLGLISYTTWESVVIWNWFKSAINLQCSDNHEEMNSFIIEPYRDLYAISVIYTIAQLVVIVFVGFVDIFHFIYIYKNELCYYLVDGSYQVLVKHDTKTEYDWIEKNKGQIEKDIINIEEIVNDEQENKSEKFKVTMALNLYENENKQPEEQLIRGKRVQKKKKKGPINRNIVQQNSLQISDDFNPYALQDSTLIGLNSRDNLIPSTTTRQIEIVEVDEQEKVRNQRKKLKKNRR